MNRSSRPIIIAGVTAVIALAACGAYMISQNSGASPEKIAQYVASVNFEKLGAADRSEAIRRLAARVNSLSVEDRRRWRLEGSWRGWFAEMTEDEKGQFIDATLPTGFRQVINEYEQFPETKRKSILDETLKTLRETHKLPMNHEPGRTEEAYGTNGPPVLSPELEKKVRALGLKTFYNASSAQTKAELAPLLEELQHQIQTGAAHL